jgi:RNA polymerase sigma-70 factor (ECF subfamily)
MPIESTDAELVSAARRDPLAFDALYRRYLPAVYRYLLARIGSVEDAEDVTSAVFLDALTGLAGYREQGRFPAWLFTIARRHAMAYHRRAPRAIGLEDADLPAPPAALGPEDFEVLRAALLRLTDERREALALRFFAGLRVQEIAAVMGKGESATKMLIHRGLLQLRELLSEGGHD